MCVDPLTIALMTTAAATGLQAYSSYQTAEATNDAAKYNARVAERNADIAETQAVSAETEGAEAEKQFRQSLARFKGTQRAALAASGVVVDVGSPLETIKETAKFGELDALTIRSNAAREAWGFRIQAEDFKTRANISRAGRVSPALAGTTSLLSGASRLADQYVRYN